MRKRREAEGTDHGATEKRRRDGKNEAYRRGGANEAPKSPAREKLLGETRPPYVHDSVRAYSFTLRVRRIVYKGMQLDTSYRVDPIVEDVVVVEMKAVAALSPVHQAQVLTYMKLTDCPAGLLINFNVPRLMDGVKRLVLPGR